MVPWYDGIDYFTEDVVVLWGLIFKSQVINKSPLGFGFILYVRLVTPQMDACSMWEEYRECLLLLGEDIEADVFADAVRVMLDGQGEVA